MKKRYLIWGMLLTFVSCSKFSKNEVVFYEKFPEVSTVSFQEISIPAVIPSAVDLLAIDNTLVAMDMMSDNFFHLFQLPDLKYKGSQIKKGQGPNEEIMIVPFLSESKGQLMYRTVNDIKIAQIKDANLIITDTIQLPTEFINVMHVIKMNDYLYGYDGITKNETEYVCYNIKTKAITKFGDFPETDLATNRPEKQNILYSKTIINKEDNSKFAALYDKIPLLRIYNKEGKLLKELVLINGQKSPSAYFEEQPNQTQLNDMMINYLKIKATNNFIYGMYAGKTHGELKTSERRNADYGLEIHVWDWDGNPVACYKLPKAIAGFTVSKDDKYICCSSMLEDNKLFRFNL